MNAFEVLDKLLLLEEGLRAAAQLRDEATTDEQRAVYEEQWQVLEEERQRINERFGQKISMAFEIHRHQRFHRNEEVEFEKQ